MIYGETGPFHKDFSGFRRAAAGKYLPISMGIAGGEIAAAIQEIQRDG